MRSTDSLRTGAIAGSAGALAMSAWFFAVRLLLGIPTPSEMFADASAPFIPVHLFGILIGVFHGYTSLKIIGFSSVVLGQLAVGAIGGVLYVRNRSSARFLAAFAFGAFVAVSTAFSTVLAGNYRGSSVPAAILLTIFSLAGGFAIFALVTALFAGLAPKAQLRESKLSQPTRATWILGGATAAAAVLGWQRVFARATFSYDGRVVTGPGVAAITPNELFYSVTKNVADPSVDPSLWSLTIEGAVEHSMRLDLAQLRTLDYVEQETTLMCINNPPEGGLMSNALWRGVPIRSLIASANPHPGVVRAILHAADNYADTIPFAKAMEATTLVAYLMNGVPLPSKHGFPARAIVPGWFGEKNVKWIRAIELVTEPVKGFYERQGWGPSFRTPTHARFDAPDFTNPIRGGTAIELRGVAFCGDRGVARVQVSDDGGATWYEAAFTSHYQQLAWRLWHFTWRPRERRDYQLAVRAWDSHGVMQTAVDRSAETQGATGYHRVTARIV